MRYGSYLPVLSPYLQTGSTEVTIMKKYGLFVLCAMLIISLIGCGSVASNLKVDYGSSSVYTQKDMEDAVKIIKENFALMDGCVLHSLSYASDDCNSYDNIEWMNDLRENDDEVFTQCIMFESSFRSPKNGGGAWEADEEYTWSWWLARTDGGSWKLMTWGYC